MREFAILPDEAYGVVMENRALLQRLLAMNIEAEKTKLAPSAIADMVLSFFSGLCIERDLKSGKTSSTRKIELYDSPSRSLIERLGPEVLVLYLTAHRGAGFVTASVRAGMRRFHIYRFFTLQL